MEDPKKLNKRIQGIEVMAVIEIYWAKLLAILALKRFCKINGIDNSLIINW
jgi:hypothetical protein